MTLDQVPMTFRRAIVIVLDGVGIGALPDAVRYGDAGCNTLGHVAERVRLRVPHLRALGLGQLVPLGGNADAAQGATGRMAAGSPGKDSVTGHWELMGVVLDRAFPVFPAGFPREAIDRLSQVSGRLVIGNGPWSGIAVIEALGDEHLHTGALIVYTSADSVCQIAAHTEVVPLPELYRICEAAYDIFCLGLGVGRVIARPFSGHPGAFVRTADRRDFALPPAGQTLFDRLSAAGFATVGIGKIDDLFGGRGLGRVIHTTSDQHGMASLVDVLSAPGDGQMIAVNLVDFDTKFGHRNDIEGFASNLERFDAALPSVLGLLRPDDLLVITADHGNDPSTPGTDHTREYVPLLATGRNVRSVNLGTRSTFADLGQTLAAMYSVPPLEHGSSFLQEISPRDNP
jgi:phosphopentomutase